MAFKNNAMNAFFKEIPVSFLTIDFRRDKNGT